MIVANATVYFGRHHSVAIYFHRLIWSKRGSSSSWALMYFLIASSSPPTVERKQPRAQKHCPAKHGRNKRCKKLFGTVASTKVLCTYTVQVVRRLKKTVESSNTTCNGRTEIR